jgi:hypothetical protein
MLGAIQQLTNSSSVQGMPLSINLALLILGQYKTLPWSPGHLVFWQTLHHISKSLLEFLDHVRLTNPSCVSGIIEHNFTAEIIIQPLSGCHIQSVLGKFVHN